MANYHFIPHTLTPLKKQRALKVISTFDIETDEWDDDTWGKTEQQVMRWHNRPLNPFLSGYLAKGKEHIFEGKDCISEFLNDYLVHDNRQYVCFAHNGGKFDFLALYETLKRDKELSERFIAKPFLAHSRIISLTIVDHDKHAWHFRDSYALLPESLKRLCEGFKPLHMKKERLHIPEGVSSWDFYQANKQEWLEYFKSDLWSLFEILQLFNNVITDIGGCVGHTIASTAMLTFRRKFLHQEIPNYFQWNDFIRRGYPGGRVEIFNMYAMECGKPYYYYDCNSEFPSVMHDNDFPVSLPRRTHYDKAEDCIGRPGMMECDIVTPPDLEIPILPYRTKEKKLLFPLGNWRGVYEHCLIEKALRYGYDIKPLRVLEFDGAPIFGGYVDTLHDLKMNSEEGAFKKVMKFLLNCLYGKFGEHQDREELITDLAEDIKGAYPWDNVFGYSLRKFKRYSAYHLPAIAARVTSLAELKLYSQIEQVQRMGGIIYYCDTDSIITDVRLPTSKLLGEWKLEHEIISAVFLAPKTYMLHTYDKDDPYKIVMKGFTEKFRHHMTFDMFRNALPPHNDFTPFFEWRVAPASMKKANIRHLDGFVTNVEPRSVRHIYDKREILDDLTTRPLQVKDGVVQWKQPPILEKEAYDYTDEY